MERDLKEGPGIEHLGAWMWWEGGKHLQWKGKSDGEVIHHYHFSLVFMGQKSTKDRLYFASRHDDEDETCSVVGLHCKTVLLLFNVTSYISKEYLSPTRRVHSIGGKKVIKSWRSLWHLVLFQCLHIYCNVCLHARVHKIVCYLFSLFSFSCMYEWWGRFEQTLRFTMCTLRA